MTPVRRFYFTAQGTDGTFHSDSGYCFGATADEAVVSARDSLLKSRPIGGTYDISMTTNDHDMDKGDEYTYQSHHFSGVLVSQDTLASYKHHVDNKRFSECVKSGEACTCFKART